LRENLHEEIEALAGAIALGEATDADRRAYREHIAHCAACLRELGGEHELVRTSAVVAEARDGEVWSPQPQNVLRRRSLGLAPAVRFAAAFAVTFGLAAASLHYVSLPARTAPVQSAANVPAPASVKRSSVAAQPLPQPQPQRRLEVYHNVVQMARAPVAPSEPHVTSVQPSVKAPEIAAVTVYPQTAPRSTSASSVPVWREPAWRTVARMTTTSLSETSPQRVSSAEMLQLRSAGRSLTNEAAPIGGETAINPQPPMIAYAEGAEGTTAFEVLIDERGTPTKCVITKPAGYRFLDEAVCKAAMKARYSPKTLDGRAVPGLYRDAFTFRVSSNESDGLPKPIH
jgi:TonB family protein